MTSYAKAGVDIERGNKVVRKIKNSVLSTWTPDVCGDFGDFGGMIHCGNQTLVTSTDGVGTKTIATIQVHGRQGYRLLGHDIVNHCVNDILVKGARPLFFLDYIASSTLVPDDIAQFVHGVSEACCKVRCVLLGGETAEMPDVYQPGHIDIVGTIVGTVDEIIDGPGNISKGNVVLGIPSSGPHTNGYSLIRKLLGPDLRPEHVEPHRCYLSEIQALRNAGVHIKGLCHITGGGYTDNIPRVLPRGLAVKLRIPQTRLFKELQTLGNLSDEEMLKTFNLGFGMLVFVDPDDAHKLPEAVELGVVIQGQTSMEISNSL